MSSWAPAISVITPVHDPPVKLLRAMLTSVLRQRGVAFELCLADDGSQDPKVHALLRQVADLPAVCLTSSGASEGIAHATNRALALATAPFVAFVDHDDRLEPGALAAVVALLTKRPATDLVYTDEARIDQNGRTLELFLKPDWSPARLRSHNYLNHLTTVRRGLVEDLGGLRAGLDGAQDHDLLLRVTEVTQRVEHLPRVLYLWTAAPGSTARDSAAKPHAHESGRRAVQDHCDRTGLPATVEPGPVPFVHRLQRRLVDEPTVSIVIPTRGSRREVEGIDVVLIDRCVRSIVQHVADVRTPEIIVVADAETSAQVLQDLATLAGPALRIVPFDEPFNFARKINVGVAASRGDHVLLLNDDTEVTQIGWLDQMQAALEEPGVGIVGVRLLYGDGRLQHGGHLYNGDPVHLFHGFPGDFPGPGNVLAVEREVSGVTAACALVHRRVWDEVGGMDERFRVNFNDVDLCLRVRAAGYRILWLPQVTLIHHESASRPAGAAPDEVALLREVWDWELNHDPYGNPNLLPRRGDLLPAVWPSPLTTARRFVDGHRSRLPRSAPG